MLSIIKMDLHLFGEGGTGTGTGTAGAGESAMGGNNPSVATKGGEYGNVVFGKQSADAGEGANQKSSTVPQGEDKDKAFEEFIKGEYKEQFTKRTQDIINKRFKETKALEDQVSSQKPLLDLLNQKYGTSDVNALLEKIESDSALWQEAADEEGMTVEQYKQMQKLKRENEAFKEQEKRVSQAREQQQAINQKMAEWNAQAEALKQKYPSFNLAEEVNNQGFLNMLKAGVPVEHAYVVTHYDDIMSGAINGTAKATQKAVVDNIRARGMRPTENGSASKSPFTVKDDVSKLSRKDRAEIARRVDRGEIIRF